MIDQPNTSGGSVVKFKEAFDQYSKTLKDTTAQLYAMSSDEETNRENDENSNSVKKLNSA